MSDIDKDSPEFKQAVADAADELAAGLKAKNAELIAKNKKLQAGSTISPEDLAAVEAERDELKAQFTEAQKTAAKAVKDAEAAAKRATEIDTAYAGSIKDAALTEALSKAGVTPALLKAAKALLGSGAEVVDENGARSVKLGGKPIGEAITEWAGSEEGKHFVAAPDSNGGGSQGGRGKPPETHGNAGGTRSEAVARAEQLLRQHASEE